MSREALESHEGLGLHQWTTTSVGELVANQEPVFILEKFTIDDACELLVANGISSAPIYSPTQQKFIGMFDFRDLAAYLLLLIKKDLPMSDEDKETLQFKTLVDKAKFHSEVEVGLVSDLSRKDPFYSVPPSTTLYHALEIFASGVHRIAVIDPSATGSRIGSRQSLPKGSKHSLKDSHDPATAEDSKHIAEEFGEEAQEYDTGLLGILTQSYVVRFLRENASRFPIAPILSSTLRALHLGQNQNIISIASDVNVLTALNEMVKNGISSMPITSKSSQKIVSSISLSDLRFIMRSHKLNMVYKSVFEFAKLVDVNVGLETGKDKYPVFDVTLNSTLKHTVDKILATRTHRIWVVDNHSRPIGVVSMTDILRALKPKTEAELEAEKTGAAAKETNAPVQASMNIIRDSDESLE